MLRQLTKALNTQLVFLSNKVFFNTKTINYNKFTKGVINLIIYLKFLYTQKGCNKTRKLTI